MRWQKIEVINGQTTFGENIFKFVIGIVPAVGLAPLLKHQAMTDSMPFAVDQCDKRKLTLQRRDIR